MRPATSELTLTSWLGSAATVPVTVTVSLTAPRSTRVTVTSATAFTSADVSSSEAGWREQANVSAVRTSTIETHSARVFI
ncbi:MAG: hypothetical protein LAO07_10105 [Acidobacteriia bacterium]|nr:hypothetical protein [Terriglobia bacterium]